MVRKSVRFVLLLYDDFTGKCITQGGHVFEVNGKIAAPIWKPEGFYVFLGPGESQIQLKIHGGIYLPETIQLDVNQLDPSFPVARVRLLRRENSGTADCEYVRGTYKPGVEVYALKQGQGMGKLLSAEKEDDRTIISFSGYYANMVGETRFMIGTGAKQELVIMGDPLPERKLLVREGFLNPHKVGEPVVRAYASRCDENGTFSIPVEKGQKDLIKEVLFKDPKTQKWNHISLA